MKSIRLIVIPLCILGMTACGPLYETHHEFVAPSTFQGKQCANRCLQEKQRCKSNCERQYESCTQAAQFSALPQYYLYVKEQKKQHKPIEKKISDFADYSLCRKHCGCDADYATCYTNCGGQIIEKRVCVAFCDKQ